MGTALSIPKDPRKGNRCPHCKKRVMANHTHSPQARAWMKSAIAQLEAQWQHVPIPIDHALVLRLVAYFPTRRLADCTSIIDAVQDALKYSEVIEDDISIEPKGCERLVDKRRPRIEATLTLKREEKNGLDNSAQIV